MTVFSKYSPNIQEFNTIDDLVSTPFRGETNAMVWKRDLKGNFAEIVNQVACLEGMLELKDEDLLELQLSHDGKIAREILIEDLRYLREIGASPILNVINYYERDESFPFFPTDVYSFHVDRSPLPTATFLCTYYGASSDILPNSQAIQKIQIPEIRKVLRKLHTGSEDDFDAFLSDNYFDLHYQAQSNAEIINLGNGHMWKLAVDHPQSKVLPCVHRAPRENSGEKRLLLIC